MKIKKISCEQFAGVRDLDVSFDDGINVIYGKNESGKSTLVNLLSRTLFQKAQIDGRRDKNFIGTYFPSVAKGKSPLKTIDGKVSIETSDGTYTLTKEWGESTRVSFSTPDGVLRRQDEVDEKLKSVLGYGEGVYSDILFSSQRNTDASLQQILANERSDAKQEIAEVLTRAYMQSDGISTDAIGQAIEDKINELKGSHWDLEMNAPVRRSSRWVNGLGKILEAFYDCEDKKQVYRRVTELEAAADKAIRVYQKREEEVKKLSDNYDKFDKFANLLEVRKAHERNLTTLGEELKKYSEALKNWPIYLEQLQKAQILLKEKQDREILDRYHDVKPIHDTLIELKAKLEKQLCPSDREINDVKQAQRNIALAEGKLCGMDLAAVIKMFGNHAIEIKSLRTGKTIGITEGKAELSEAVSITIPGVMEMQLAPADVDVAAIEAQLNSQKGIIKSIFDKYHVDSEAALENLAKQYFQDETNLRFCESQLSTKLGEISFEDAERAARVVSPDLRSKAEIAADISSICGSMEIVAFIGDRRANTDRYVREYGILKSLSEKSGQVQREYDALKESLDKEDDIPVEYLNVADPQQYKQKLKVALDGERKDLQSAIEEKSAAQSALETYKGALGDDPLADLEAAKRKFDEISSELAHWVHIKKVFDTLKENISNNPMHDIAESFSKYLEIISEGRVSSEFLSQERIDIDVYSNDRRLDYDKLSEGTKETVSLAFRLAVLDHLFPNGGGVIVFDDPFSDMDASRTVQATKLIRECATRHQVILLTCKEDYAKMFNGKRINF